MTLIIRYYNFTCRDLFDFADSNPQGWQESLHIELLPGER